MHGNKFITDLITDPNQLLQGRINIIDAGVSAGKTTFALTKLPEWAGGPEKVLYLIDTTNGEMRLQKNGIIDAIGRLEYAFYDYSRMLAFGDESAGKMPIMTYAGFGSEILKKDTAFTWWDYKYIICDEMQNLVNYQRFNDRSKNLEAAEDILRTIAEMGETTIVAMSATPQIIRDRFGELCYEVPFDHSELINLCTSTEIPYNGSPQRILNCNKGKTGILYITEIWNMENYIDYANSIGYRAAGFWSISPETQKRHPMTPEQYHLRECVLENETIPENVNLLVINRASETCIKIKESNRKVDFMIVHDKNGEIRTQVRGRYHGDLETFYYHDTEAANRYTASTGVIPERFIGRRLYTEDQDELCRILNLGKPHGGSYSKPTVAKYLRECGYEVSESKKDSHCGGKYYRVISAKKDTIPGVVL